MNYKDLILAARLMGQGMIALFVVMGLLFAVVYFLTKRKSK